MLLMSAFYSSCFLLSERGTGAATTACVSCSAQREREREGPGKVANPERKETEERLAQGQDSARPSLSTAISSRAHTAIDIVSSAHDQIPTLLLPCSPLCTKFGSCVVLTADIEKVALSVNYLPWLQRYCWPK